MSSLIDRLTGHTEMVEARKPVPCVTPGCHHVVHEPWEESGLLCDECALEGELYDREARWDHVCPIPGTACLPCAQRDTEKREALELRAKTRTSH
jgi:hypothetical protein